MNYSSGVSNTLDKNREKSSQNDNGNKRKRPATANHTRQLVKRKENANVSNNMATPFDSILNEIEAFDSTNRKRDANRMKNEMRSDDNSPPCSSKQLLPPTPALNSSFKTLTKSELMRSEEDTKILRSILNKDGLMERILGYKMIRGRVESCATIRNLIDLDNCVSPEYEEVEDVKDYERRYPAVPFRDMPSNVLCTPPHQASPDLIAQTPAYSDKMTSSFGGGGTHGKSHVLTSAQISEPRRGRGPKTPPGSPPRANRSRSPSICSSASTAPHNDDAMATAISDDDACAPKKPRRNSCTPLPPPPAFPDMRESQSKATRRDGKSLPKTHLSNYENAVEDSEALLRQFSEVTNTPVSHLREYIGEDLQAAIGRIDRSVLLSTLKNALKNVTVDITPPPPVPHNNYNNSRRENDAEIRPSSIGDGCEMEISSEHSNGRPSGEGSSQLLPPPPPPVISPPPPPPPLFAPQTSTEALCKQVTSSTLNTLPTVNLCVPPPQIPSCGLTTNTTSNILALPVSSDAPATGSLVSNVPPPTFSCSSNTALSSSSFTLPPPVISSANASPKVIRVDLTQKGGNLSTAATAPSNSAKTQANLTPPQPPAKIVVNLSAQLKKNPGSSSQTSQRQHRVRPAPTVNMDFIKSRPPPPIPEILRKNISSESSSPASSSVTPAAATTDTTQPTRLFKTQVAAPPPPPTTISTVDLTKLVAAPTPSTPKATLLQNMPSTATSVDSSNVNSTMAFFVPNIPPPGFNKSSESNSRPTSRLSGPLQNTVELPPLNTPPPKTSTNNLSMNKPIEMTLPPKNSLMSNFQNTVESVSRPSTSYHNYKQPLLPSPGCPPPMSNDRKEPQRKTLIPHSSEKNIFKTLMSALNTTAAAVALAQALPQYTNSSSQQPSVTSRAPAPASSQPSMDTILANVLAANTPSNNSAAPKFNFANISQHDLNASIATFVRALTSGAAAKNAVGQPKYAPRNMHYRPPRPS